MKLTTIGTALAVSGLLFLASCGGGGGSSPPPVIEPDPPTTAPDPTPDPEPDPEPTPDPEPEPTPEPDPDPPPGVPDLEIAPQPTGLSVDTGLDIALLFWDNPHLAYANHGLTRIYRSTANDFATASEIGTSTGISYVDNTAKGNTTYYYWIAWETDEGGLGTPLSSTGATPSPDPVDEIARLSEEILNDPLTWELSNLHWRTSATLGGASLFSAAINDDRSIVVQGTLSGTNPVGGTASWSGKVGAYDVRIGTSGPPITGHARLAVDFGDATLNVDFTDFTQGHSDMSWRGLALTNGAFEDFTIEGAFYGTGHQGVAGEFERDQLRGAFGAIRE